MSTRWYNILFGFEVLHNFYDSGFSNDIAIQPTTATAQKIAGVRHLLKRKNNQPILLFEATDNQRTPLIPFTGDTRLVFTGQLTNSYFSNFTNLPAKHGHQVYVFDNLNGTILQQTPATIKPQVFAFEFTTTRVNATLEITDRQGNTVLNEALHNSEKKFSKNLKLYGTEGLHRFTVTTTQGIEVDEQIYISNELTQNKPWCVIEIFQQGGTQFNYSTETIYQLQFVASQKPWQYILYLSKDYLNASFNLEDKENYGTPHSHPYTKIDFVETSGNQTYEKGQMVSFTSGTLNGNNVNPQLIPFYEKAKKQLQLTINKNGTETILSPLPIPSALSPNQEVYITI